MYAATIDQRENIGECNLTCKADLGTTSPDPVYCDLKYKNVLPMHDYRTSHLESIAHSYNGDSSQKQQQ